MSGAGEEEGDLLHTFHIQRPQQWKTSALIKLFLQDLLLMDKLKMVIFCSYCLEQSQYYSDYIKV